MLDAYELAEPKYPSRSLVKFSHKIMLFLHFISHKNKKMVNIQKLNTINKQSSSKANVSLNVLLTYIVHNSVAQVSKVLFRIFLPKNIARACEYSTIV